MLYIVTTYYTHQKIAIKAFNIITFIFILLHIIIHLKMYADEYVTGY